MLNYKKKIVIFRIETAKEKFQTNGVRETTSGVVGNMLNSNTVVTEFEP